MKSRTIRKVAATSLAAVAFVLLGAGSASASTFCVPAFFAGCTNNGTNVAQANLETAMSTNSADGIPDVVMIDDFDYVDANSLMPTGSDDLEVIGSGTGKTTLSSSATGNGFVVNLGNRKTDMSNLTIVIPASFPDAGGNGAALQARDGTFDHVDIRSLNTRSEGADSLIGDTVWKNSRIYGEAGGSIGNGITPNEFSPGKLEIINTTIEDSVWGLSIDGSEVPVVMKRSRVINPVGYGAYVAQGGLFVMENSIVEGAGLEAVRASSTNVPGESDIDVSIRASTFIAEPSPDTAAIKLTVNGSHDLGVDVSDSILHGYENTWEIDAPFGPGLGNALLTFTFSDFKPVGLPDGSPNVDFSNPGNIDFDPELTSDLILKAGSPAIDAGGPENGGILEDYAGNVRPQDGDGDGTFVRDMGAFEAPTIPTCVNTEALCPVNTCENTPSLCPVATCENTPSLCPVKDKVKPKITKVKFKSPRGKKKGSLKLKLSKDAKITATFKPTPKGQGKKQRKTLKLKKSGKKGLNTLVIRKGKLKKGKYRLTISAIDAAGNKSKSVVRKVKVKPNR